MQALELKYNCFFLMPVIDTFPTRLREEIEAAYVDNLDGVFDVGAVRDALNTRLHSLESELHQVGQPCNSLSTVCRRLLCVQRSGSETNGSLAARELACA